MPPSGRLRRTAAEALAPPLAVVCIIGLDRVAGARPWPIPVIGLLDEPAHLLTAWLMLNAVAAAHRRFWPWALLGAVAIDVDHVPLYLWGSTVAGTGGRPVTHSLMTVLALLALGIAVRRARTVCVGLAVGVVLHLTRDLATGPGVPLWWPARSDPVLLPYWGYLCLLVALAATAVLQHSRPRRTPTNPGGMLAVPQRPRGAPLPTRDRLP